MQNDVFFIYFGTVATHTHTHTAYTHTAYTHTGPQKNAELKCLGLDAACKAV